VPLRYSRRHRTSSTFTFDVGGPSRAWQGFFANATKTHYRERAFLPARSELERPGSAVQAQGRISLGRRCLHAPMRERWERTLLEALASDVHPDPRRLRRGALWQSLVPHDGSN